MEIQPRRITEDIHQYREETDISSPEQSVETESSSNLSPQLPPLEPSSPIDTRLIDNFANLLLDPEDRRLIEQRLIDIRREWRAWNDSLHTERSRAISIVNAATSIALDSVRDRLSPEIERLEALLRRSD